MLTTKLKTQPGSSDTYSGEQNELDLSTAHAQHLSVSDGFRAGLHGPQRPNQSDPAPPSSNPNSTLRMSQ